MSKHTHMYHNARWRKLRLAILSQHPWCTMCEERQPPQIRPATVLDHIKPHCGDLDLFWSLDNLQPLCDNCHNQIKQRLDNQIKQCGKTVDSMFDEDGRLIDPWGE